MDIIAIPKSKFEKTVEKRAVSPLKMAVYLISAVFKKITLFNIHNIHKPKNYSCPFLIILATYIKKPV